MPFGLRRHEIGTTHALRVPLVGRVVLGGLGLGFVDDATGRLLGEVHVAIAGEAALVCQRRPSDSPASTHLTDDVGVRHHRVGQEDLHERVAVVHLLDRPHLDAGLVHVDHEVGDALVLHRVPVGASHEDRHVGVIGTGVPDLLAVDDPAVAVAHGRRLHAGQVGTGAGFGEQLAPRVFAGDGRPQHTRPQVIGAVLVDRRRSQRERSAQRNRHTTRSPNGRVRDPIGPCGQSPTEPVGRPRRHCPTRLEQRGAPLDQAERRVPRAVEPLEDLAPDVGFGDRHASTQPSAPRWCCSVSVTNTLRVSTTSVSQPPTMSSSWSKVHTSSARPTSARDHSRYRPISRPPTQ